MESELEIKKPCKNVVDINGQIANGKQFDLDITLPDVSRKKYHKYFPCPL